MYCNGVVGSASVHDMITSIKITTEQLDYARRIISWLL